MTAIFLAAILNVGLVHAGDWSDDWIARLSSDDCKAIASGDRSRCDTADCKGIAARDRNWCDSNDCKGVATGDRTWCGSALCKAWASKDRSWCGNNDCKGVASSDRSFCDSDQCKAIASADPSWCSSSTTGAAQPPAVAATAPATSTVPARATGSMPWKQHVRVSSQLKNEPKFDGNLEHFPFDKIEADLWRQYDLDIPASQVGTRFTGKTPEGDSFAAYPHGVMIKGSGIETWVQNAPRLVQITFPSGLKLAVTAEGYAQVTTAAGKTKSRYIAKVEYKDDTRVTPKAGIVLYEQKDDPDCGVGGSSNQFKIGNLQVNVLGPRKDSLTCAVTVGPESDFERKVLSKRGRSFVMSREEFVHNIVTEDNERISLSTGTRGYYLFPRIRRPVKVRLGSDATEVIVDTASGLTATFDTETTEIKSIEGAKFKTILPIRGAKFKQLDAKGGAWEFTLPPEGRLLLDSGWQKGGAVQSMKAKSTFIDRKGNRCEIRNSLIFKLREKGNDDVVPLHEDEQSLRAFLAKNCSGLGSI